MAYTKEIIAKQISENTEKIKRNEATYEDIQVFIKSCINFCGDTKKLAFDSLKESCEGIDKFIDCAQKAKVEFNKQVRSIKDTIKRAKKIHNNEVQPLIEQAEDLLKTCKKLIKDFKHIISELKKIKHKTLKPIRDVKINTFFNYFIWICFANLVVILSTIKNKNIEILVSSVGGFFLLLFILFKIYFIHTTIINKEKDLPYKILVWASKITSYLAIVWLFAIFISFNFRSKVSDFYAIALIVIIALKMAVLFYEFFCDTKFYSNIGENILLLIISIILAISTITPVIKNEIVNEIAKLLIIVVALYLTAFIVKYMILDKPKVSDVLEISALIITLVLTIGLSILSIYNYFWVKGASEQPLFTAITGVYAAIIGGSLTLAGVAWTIRKGDDIRKEDEKKKYKPIINITQASKSIIKLLKVKDRIKNKIVIGQSNNENYINEIYINNTEFCSFFLSGLVINGNIYPFNIESYVEKNAIIAFIFEDMLIFADNMVSCKILIKDLLDNYYAMPVFFKTETSKPAMKEYVISGNRYTIKQINYDKECCVISAYDFGRLETVSKEDIEKLINGEQSNV